MINDFEHTRFMLTYQKTARGVYKLIETQIEKGRYIVFNEIEGTEDQL